MRKATQVQETDTTGGGIGRENETVKEDESIFDNVRGKFSFEQVPQVSVSFVDCSVQNKQIDDVYRFLLSKLA